MKRVFIRLDKIGDLIATLPVDQLSPTPVFWVISQGLGWIAELAEPSRPYLQLSLNSPLRSFLQLYRFLKSEKPEVTVIFYAPWWASLACFLARVPTRVGRLSQWHSFVFFNRGLRQSRSLASQHEADYNRELVEFALQLPKHETPFLKLRPSVDVQLLQKWNLQNRSYFVVHPGMFGSALNWPQSRYNELIEKLVEQHPVAITGTAGDERFLDHIKERWQEDSRVLILQDQLTMAQLLSLLSTAKAVIAPSTGVLHLAASLGTSCVGIYSPVQVHHPRRWGPRGKNASFVLPPEEETPQMEKISVENILTELAKVQNQ